MFPRLLPGLKEISEARLLLTTVRSSELLSKGAVEHVTEAVAETATHPVAVRPIIRS